MCDVSVEMLLLGRLLGLPTATILMRGRRDDGAHALGYDVARHHRVVHVRALGLPDGQIDFWALRHLRAQLGVEVFLGRIKNLLDADSTNNLLGLLGDQDGGASSA